MTGVAACILGAVVAAGTAGVARGFVLCAVPGLRPASTAWGAKRTSAAITPAVGRRPGSAMQMHKVTIEHEGKSYALEVPETMTILEAALDNDISLPHDCKLGVCLTCPSVVVSGDVDQSDGTLDVGVVEQGFALTCCSYPRSDVVIRSVEEDELVGAQFSDRST